MDRRLKVDNCREVDVERYKYRYTYRYRYRHRHRFRCRYIYSDTCIDIHAIKFR